MRNKEEGRKFFKMITGHHAPWGNKVAVQKGDNLYMM